MPSGNDPMNFATFRPGSRKRFVNGTSGLKACRRNKDGHSGKNGNKCPRNSGTGYKDVFAHRRPVAGGIFRVGNVKAAKDSADN
jgi:hypothetical protein